MNRDDNMTKMTPIKSVNSNEIIFKWKQFGKCKNKFMLSYYGRKYFSKRTESRFDYGLDYSCLGKKCPYYKECVIQDKIISIKKGVKKYGK